MFSRHWLDRNLNFEADRRVVRMVGSEVYEGIRSRFLGSPVAIFHTIQFGETASLPYHVIHYVTKAEAEKFISNLSSAELMNGRTDTLASQYTRAKKALERFNSLG